MNSDNNKNSPLEHLSISIIVAIAENNAIGKNNQLLWHLPADLKHFKELTSGHPIIMGRKTFDSIGKALPNRKNIVITRQTDLKIPNVDVVNTFTEALSCCDQQEEIFIIGGAEIYKFALPITNKIYLTTVHQRYEADAFFPDLDKTQWKTIAQEYHKSDEKNSVDYTFSTLHRL